MDVAVRGRRDRDRDKDKDRDGRGGESKDAKYDGRVQAVLVCAGTGCCMGEARRG